MKRAAVFSLVALGACAGPAANGVLAPAPQRPAPRCPDAPRLEWFAWDAALDRLGRAARTAGHITALEDATADGPASLVGTFDVKGALRFSALSNALAHDAALHPARAPYHLALTLDGARIGSFAATTTIRGARFRVPLRDPGDDAWRGALVTRLAAALDDDRRCFAATPAAPDETRTGLEAPEP